MKIRKNILRLQKYLQTQKALLIVVLFIILGNAAIYSISNYKNFPNIQSRQDATGFCMPYASQFFYFFYYTHHFPLATLHQNLTYSEASAKHEIATNGKDLIMEYKHWSRLGENARIFIFLPNAWLKGSAEAPSIKLFNALLFISSLLVLYIGFWKIDKALFGLIVVTLVNITPFFLYEIYWRQNIFGLLGAVFFLILGLNIKALTNLPIHGYKLLLNGIISSLIIGFCSEIRNEISLVCLSLFLIFCCATQLKVMQKIIVVTTCFIAFYGSKQLIRNYFENQFQQTTQLVTEQNGHVYTGNRITGHKIWHNVFCGLGDFDNTYHYKWDDRVAYQYAVPILNQQYGMHIHYSGKYHTDDYYDKDSLYYIKFEEIENYDKVVKNKVLNDMSQHPWWYIEILLKRLAKLFTYTIPFPMIGWLLLPLLYFLFKNREYLSIKLIFVAFPLSISSMLVYSGDGNTYNSVFPYFILLALISLMLKNKLLDKPITN